MYVVYAHLEKIYAIENRYGRVHSKTKNTKHRKNNINDFENHVCTYVCIDMCVCVRILNEFRKKLLLKLQLQQQQQMYRTKSSKNTKTQ